MKSQDNAGRINLPVRGPLDTADPISDRPPGTLVEAIDLSPRYWGPRVGSLAFTRIWEGPGTASLYDYITLKGTNNARGLGRSYEPQFRDLGTTFTLDLWFRIEEWTYAASAVEVGIYEFSCSGIGDISVGVYGGTQGGNELKLKVGITTSASRSSPASTVTITGTTALSTGTTELDKHHVRVVREGATATVFLNGAQDGQTTSLSATNPINSGFNSPGNVILGISSTSDLSFYGRIFGAVLRDGAFDTHPIEKVMPHDPWARTVRHYILGRDVTFGGEHHFFDAGRFAVHPRLIYNSGSDYSVTSSNDNGFPAPAVVQGMRTWTSRYNRTVTSVMAGGALSSSIVP